MIGRVIAGRYKIVALLGEGGMAVVYRAIDLNTSQSVAIKILKQEFSKDAEYVARFQREAAAASKMDHHNVVKLLDVGMDNGDRYLVMEFVQGRTLKDLIQEKGRLNEMTAATITLRILSGLQHAHENNIIHRDIKPQNILVRADGNIKVSDFGIARIPNTDTLTKNDTVIGSVHYFSPEQARGGSADQRSDIYSVGVCLYEMLTGRVPFDGDSQVAIAMQHIQQQPEPIENLAPDVSRGLIHICSIAMDKNPRCRYQTAKEMGIEIRKFIEGRTDELKPHRIPPAPYDNGGSGAGTNAGTNTDQTNGMHTENGVVRWIMTALLAIALFLGLYFGGVRIYERVVNSATVPDMIGMESGQAERAAARAGLTIRIVQVYNNSVPAGDVITQAPEADTTMRKNDTVVLTVSKGVATQQTPLLIGMTTTAAIETLQLYGMTLTVTERSVSDKPLDTIMTQYPESGATCQPGDVVHVTVSGGSAFVPSLTGKSLSEAQELLESQGLQRNPNLLYIECNDASLHGLVAEQSLDAGIRVTVGTAVTLTLYRVPSLTHAAKVPIQLPDTDGRSMTVKVYLTAGSSEVLQYQADYSSTSAAQAEVELSADKAGSYQYSVYLNDVFAYQDQVNLF